MRFAERRFGRVLVVALSAIVALFGIVSSAGAAGDGIPRPPGAIDNRGYEMVSPTDKNGLEVNVAMDISPDGNTALFGMFGGAPQSTAGAQSWLRATRTGSGWVSENVLPPASEQPDENYQLITASRDLLRTVWSAQTGLGQQGATPRFAITRIANGSQTILQRFDTYFGVSGGEFIGADDMANVYGAVPVPLDASHQPDTWNIYDFGTGAPALMSVMPSTGQAPLCGVESDKGFAKNGSQARDAQHWASTDGTHLFFMTQGDNCSDPLELYSRDRATSTTTLISGPITSGTDQGVDAMLQAAADGTWVIYRTASALDAVDTDATPDIYRYSVGGENQCLTCVATDPANVSTNVGGDTTLASVVSEDGSHVYFISQDQIDGQGVPGDNNLYVWREGEIRYISPSDGVTPLPSASGQVTPDGQVLLFPSSQPGLNTLTGTDNGGHIQIYRYDDSTGELNCISCPSNGPATTDIRRLVRAALPIVETRGAMSDDGSIIAFPTNDALVPADVNQGSDVYEWHDGQIGLLTSGTMVYSAGTHSDLVSVSPSGNDILIEDFEKLTQDPQDDATKLFDVRVDGGFPPATSPAPCDGDACHGLPSAPPAMGNPGSATLDGSGNVVTKPPVRFAVTRVTPKQRARLARTGRLDLTVRIGAGGKLTAFAQTRLTGKGVRVVARASKVARKGGAVTLSLRLSRVARAQLAATGRLRLVLAVRYSKSRTIERRVLSVKEPAARGAGVHVPATANGR